MINIMYSSVAYPPDGIVLSKVYQYGKDKNGSFISDSINILYLDDELIKSIFTPVNSTWNETVKKK